MFERFTQPARSAVVRAQEHARTAQHNEVEAADLLTAVLATSPGGLDSVAIIAVGSKADVSFVLAVQTLRLFVVLLTGPLLAKCISRSVPEEAVR